MDSNNSKVLERLLTSPQYSLRQEDKSTLLLEELRLLTAFHKSRCSAYRRIVEGTQGASGRSPEALHDIPFLPVRLFKSLKLQSVPDGEVFKVLTSSGTTSQQVSRIILDGPTSRLQTKALASIITSFIGPKRLPMIIIDSASILKDRSSMSARGAGLVGLSNFGRDHFYALDSEMRLDIKGLKEYAERHAGEPILMFGFTFMVWQYFHQELRRLGEKLELRQALLIHSGGWKKLEDQAVTNGIFKSALQEQCGISRIHNFYGMVEQVGGIYMECEEGFFHAPNVADVLVRDPRDWSVLPPGDKGAIQTFSVLPRSYPGHSLLTEDIGALHGVDDCPCGRKGVRLKVYGRMPRAELRGCSDTHAFSRASQSDGDHLRQFLPERTLATAIESICTDEFLGQEPMPAFDPLAVDFLDRASAEILKLPSVKEFPELAALAFWLRKANVRAMVTNFQKAVAEGELVQPLGMAFHVAPSNVDTIFFYSWALALLAGNLNVVRVSQAVAPQLDLLLDVVARVLTDRSMQPIRQRNIVLTYPHDDRSSLFLSQRADARLIWGGDETVRKLRSLPAKPTTRDISFADKISSCIINAERYVDMQEAARASTARAFYNDAYQFDQLACSSPLFVIFAGPEAICEAASEMFWAALTEEVQRHQPSESMTTMMDKLVGAFELIGRELGAKWKHGRNSPCLTVVRVPPASVVGCRDRLGGGFFIECTVEEAIRIAPMIQRGDQTLSYIGYTREEMSKVARLLSVRGIDRIVPVGRALNFEPVWDGYVLLSELTRRVVVS